MESESEPRMVGSRAGVVVVGSITADVTSFSERLPQRGETVLGSDFTLVLGGKGANQAVACAHAGVTAHLVGCVGDDLFRDLVLGTLADKGVDISHVHVIDAPTGVAHIRVDSSGENDIVIIPLANARLTREHVEAAIRGLADSASVLLTQLEIPREIAMHSIRVAKESGLTVLLDPAPALALEDELWAHVDIVTPNETEAGLITGITVVDQDSAIAAGRWFCARGVRHAIVTLAAAGAVLVSGDDSLWFEAFPVNAIDTTAAGDAFAGYLGAALAEGFDLREAIPRAMAAGALAVTKRGASPSLPIRIDVDRFLANQSVCAGRLGKSPS